MRNETAPRPWHIQQVGKDGGVIRDAEKRLVAFGGDGDTYLLLADAELIVRAVNAYDDMRQFVNDALCWLAMPDSMVRRGHELLKDGELPPVRPVPRS